MTIKKLKSIDIINVLSDLVSEKLETTVKLPTLKGSSKAVGIKEFIKELGRDINDTIAFGDGRNDIEMIEETGLGIAMGNAVPELKSVAKYVTANIEEEGIAAACKHFNYISD